MTVAAKNNRPMTNISVEVKDEGSTFTVEARAKSIERAINAVKNLYSTNNATVVFPVEPDSFFVEGGAESIRREPGRKRPIEPGEGVSFEGAPPEASLRGDGACSAATPVATRKQCHGDHPDPVSDAKAGASRKSEPSAPPLPAFTGGAL